MNQSENKQRIKSNLIKNQIKVDTKRTHTSIDTLRLYEISAEGSREKREGDGCVLTSQTNIKPAFGKTKLKDRSPNILNFAR